MLHYWCGLYATVPMWPPVLGQTKWALQVRLNEHISNTRKGFKNHLISRHYVRFQCTLYFVFIIWVVDDNASQSTHVYHFHLFYFFVQPKQFALGC